MEDKEKIKKEIEKRIKKYKKRINTEYMTEADFIVLELTDIIKFIDNM